MPMRRRPASRPTRPAVSAHTRATTAPTVRQAMRISSVTALDERPYRAQVQGPPPSASLAAVVARAAPPAHPAPSPLPPPGPDRRHDHTFVLVEVDTLNHRLLDPEQPSPYPGTTHAVLRRLRL